MGHACHVERATCPVLKLEGLNEVASRRPGSGSAQVKLTAIAARRVGLPGPSRRSAPTTPPHSPDVSSDAVARAAAARITALAMWLIDASHAVFVLT